MEARVRLGATRPGGCATETHRPGPYGRAPEAPPRPHAGPRRLGTGRPGTPPAAAAPDRAPGGITLRRTGGTVRPSGVLAWGPDSAEPLQQPGSNVAPLPVQRPLRQAKDFRRLGRRQPAEVAQQHDLRL